MLYILHTDSYMYLTYTQDSVSYTIHIYIYILYQLDARFIENVYIPYIRFKLYICFKYIYTLYIHYIYLMYTQDTVYTPHIHYASYELSIHHVYALCTLYKPDTYITYIYINNLSSLAPNGITRTSQGLEPIH